MKLDMDLARKILLAIKEKDDFLDVSRDDTIWNKAKASIKSKSLPLTFDLLKAALTEAVMSQFIK